MADVGVGLVEVRALGVLALVNHTLPAAGVGPVVQVEVVVKRGEEASLLHALRSSRADAVSGVKSEGLGAEQPGEEVGRVVAVEGVAGARVVLGELGVTEGGVHRQARAN